MPIFEGLRQESVGACQQHDALTASDSLLMEYGNAVDVQQVAKKHKNAIEETWQTRRDMNDAMAKMQDDMSGAMHKGNEYIRTKEKATAPVGAYRAANKAPARASRG